VSGTGAFACQLAKKVFHAGKVITTVSTSKIPLVPELLGEGVVDESMFMSSPDIRRYSLSLMPST
jgi:NADPH:quinone reductase-like Zn-dependent oxidoreductase